MVKTTGKKRLSFSIISFIFIVIVIFVLGLVLGRGNSQKTYKTKASENVAVISTTASSVKPNVVGVITSIQPVNNGNKTMIVNGISEADYLTTRKTNTKFNSKNYLIIVTPKTKVTVAGTPKMLLTTSDLKKDLKVSIFTSGDLVTALQIEID